MKYEINYPLNADQKNELLENLSVTEGNEVLIVSGQNPTLSEMLETMTWAADNIDPDVVSFSIDAKYTGDDEYTSIFAYLDSRGYKVHNPSKRPETTISLPVFEEIEPLPPITSFSDSVNGTIEGIPWEDAASYSYATAAPSLRSYTTDSQIAVYALVGLAIVLSYVAGTHARR